MMLLVSDKHYQTTSASASAFDQQLFAESPKLSSEIIIMVTYLLNLINVIRDIITVIMS